MKKVALIVLGCAFLGGTLVVDGQILQRLNILLRSLSDVEAGIEETLPGYEGAAPATVAFLDRDRPHKGPDLARWYFEEWHYPYPGILDQQVTDRIWSEVEALPDEDEVGENLTVNNWQIIGPYGMRNADGGQWTGRILDVEAESASSIRVAAASGGLWEFLFGIPIPMTETLKSQCVSTFSTHPNDSDTIILGTGEPDISGGKGLYKRTGSTDWTRKPMSPEPSGFYRVRYAPNGNSVHAATTSGYYRSTDGGETWSRTLSFARCTDLAFNPLNPNVIYTTVWGHGLYKSTNLGASWAQVTSPGIPTSGVTRGAVATTNGNGSGRMYVAFAGNDYRVQGVYLCWDLEGNTWSTVTPPVEYMWGQGWYDNMLVVSPTNNGNVLVGGGSLWVSRTGGAEWQQFQSYPHLHVDYHAGYWHSDGLQVWLGHDGGWSYSADNAQTWESGGNYQPITQYVNIHTGKNDVNLIGGGSQDNGMSITENGGVNWHYRHGGDGAGFSVDPNDANQVYCVDGVYGGGIGFRRFRSTNKGASWTDINTGIDPSTTWNPRIRNDQVAPIYLYTNANNFVYETRDFGGSWVKLNSGFPANVHELTATRFVNPSAVLYACSPTTGAGKLHVYDQQVWHDRGGSLPSSVYVRKVAPHHTDPNKAYAIMNGLGTPGQKIYRTSNRGQTWINVTGDMPDQPLSDLVVHPTNDNTLYLSSEFGCFRSTNGGTNWHRWNNGMPDAAIVTELGTLDRRAIDGTFWIVAGTYGRGIYKRDIAGDDPVAVADEFPVNRELRQNYPNPVQGTTTIEFSLPSAGRAELGVYDVSGREIVKLVNGERTAGTHRVEFDTSKLAAGTYFYKLTTEGAVETKKMIVAR